MSKIQKTPVTLKLPKNIGAMHISNDLSLVERKIMNVILWHALKAEQQNLIFHHQDKKKYYKITLSEITEYIGWDGSHNISAIKNSMKNLVETSLRFNIFDKQKTNDGRWNVITNLLGGAIFHENGQEILYCFSDIIKDIILKPTLYGTLDLELQQNINSKYTLALWEYLVGEIALNNHNCTTEYLTMEDYVKLVAGSQTKYTEFRKISEKLIKKPSQELIEKTDIHFEPEYLKEGRRVVAIRFGVQPHKREPKARKVALNANQQDALLQISSNNQYEINERLVDLGVSESKRKQYVNQHSKEYLLHNINYVTSKYSKTSNNIAGMVVKAIEENYANYNVTRTSKQQLKAFADILKPIYMPQHIYSNECIYKNLKDYKDPNNPNLQSTKKRLQEIFDIISYVEHEINTSNHSIWDVLSLIHIQKQSKLEQMLIDNADIALVEFEKIRQQFSS